MDYVRIIDALQRKCKEETSEPCHPKSGLYNNTRMRKRLDCMAAHVKALGCDPSQVEKISEEIMMFNAKRLRAAWRGDDDNVNTYIDAWLESHSMPKGDHGDKEDGSGDGKRGDGDGDGEDHGDGDKGEGEGKSDERPEEKGGDKSPGDGDDGDGDGDGDGDDSDDGDPKDGDSDGKPKPADGSEGKPSDRKFEMPENYGGSEGEDEEEKEEEEDGEGNEEEGESETPKYPPVDEDYIPPESWDQLCAIIEYNKANPKRRKNVILVGPKGTGKTEMVFQAAKKFFADSNPEPFALTAPQQEWKIVGYADANGKEVSVPFLKGYMSPGIILIDEIDRSQPEALIAVNMGLANRCMDTPTRGLVHQHPECTVIATANTSGTGATNEYGTANKLDASTRDRFVFILVKWEHKIAMRIAKGDESLVSGIEDWNTACDNNGFLEYMASYRAIIDIQDMMTIGLTLDQAVQEVIIKFAVNKTDLGQILEGMNNKRGKIYQALKRVKEAMPDNEMGF